MGETTVETHTVQNKMGESVRCSADGAKLEVSVSFGKFENDDTLSWEKWSSFSQNKYLEEVEKCSTPGSVAQKKAYFEAHYKRIAARKAEQVEEEKSGPRTPPSREEPKSRDHIENVSVADAGFGLTNNERSGDEVGQEANLTNGSCRTTPDNPTEGSAVSVPLRDTSGIAVESETLLVEEVKDETNPDHSNLEPVNREKSVLVEETSLTGSQVTLEHSLKSESKADKSSVKKKDNSKLNPRNVVQKKTPIKTKTEQNGGATKKKTVVPATRSAQHPTSKFSKTTSATSMRSASLSSSKKAIGSSLPKSKNSVDGVKKRAAPTALHMSLSLGPPENPPAAVPAARKSLIMESMGDKDIVKIAFKSFQNNYSEIRSINEKIKIKQVSSMVPERKVSSSLTPQKENKGLKKAEVKTITQRGQSASRINSVSSGLPKSSGAERKNIATASPSVGLRSHGRADKGKEEGKEVEIRKLRQSLNSKATPAPAVSRGEGKI